VPGVACWRRLVRRTLGGGELLGGRELLGGNLMKV
jgi:hypothetical protein